MKHLVVLSEIESKTHKWFVIEKPPLVITWRAMYFMMTGFGELKPGIMQYNYIEVYGVPLRAISSSEVVECHTK